MRRDPIHQGRPSYLTETKPEREFRERDELLRENEALKHKLSVAEKQAAAAVALLQRRPR
jgi:hypothetical protein